MPSIECNACFEENFTDGRLTEMADKGEALREEIDKLWNEALALRGKCSDLLVKVGSDFNTSIWSSEEERELLDCSGKKSGVLGMFQSIGRDMLVSVGDVIYSVDRKLKLGELNDLKKAAHRIFDRGNTLFGEANAIIRQFGFEPIHFNNALRYGDFELDNSASNGDWGDDFQCVYDELDKALTDFLEVAERFLEGFTLKNNKTGHHEGRGLLGRDFGFYS